MSELTVHYMRWAKGHAPGSLDLASSGMPSVDPRRAGLLFEDTAYLEPAGSTLPPLRELVAHWLGARPAQVLTGIGTSGTNVLALRAIAQPGDTVLVETPVYECLWKLAELFGMKVRHFRRDPFAEHSLTREALEAAWVPGTRAVMLSNLFNPGGNRLSTAELDLLDDFARDRDLRVLIDEVYQPFSEQGSGQRHLSWKHSPRFVSTLSLTKAWGLSCLRLGLLACQDEDIPVRADHLNDSLTVVAPIVSEHAARQLFARPESLDLLLLPHLERIERNFRTLVEACDTAGIRVSRRHAGLCCLLGIPGTPDLTAFTERLLAERSLVVVDGAFFRAPGHLRIGLGALESVFDRGLAILLEELGTVIRSTPPSVIRVPGAPE
jgi:aspartate/methionine/tyrosine aminotransferase